MRGLVILTSMKRIRENIPSGILKFYGIKKKEKWRYCSWVEWGKKKNGERRKIDEKDVLLECNLTGLFKDKIYFL